MSLWIKLVGKKDWMDFWNQIFILFLKKYIFLPITDQRTKPWLLSDTPGPLFTILGTYLYFCLYAGPRFMKDRKPFQLKNTLIWYNAIQVLASIVLVWEVGQLIDPFTQFSGVLHLRILFSRA